MLIQIAWRNVWRSRLRSGIVIAAIAIGLFAGLFFMGFSWGLSIQRVDSAIAGEFSHIQVHNPGWKEDHSTRDTVTGGMALIREIQQRPSVKAASARVMNEGMFTTARGATGIQIHGVEPEEEIALTHLNETLVEGQYLDSARGTPILVGKSLAEKYKLRLRNTVVLTFQDASGHVTSGAFKVSGFYQTVNAKNDQSKVFVKRSDLQALMGMDAEVHEIAILLQNPDSVPEVQASLVAERPDLKVETWKELAPDLRLIVDAVGSKMMVFMVIILLALGFGIVNTMMMSVLERTRELGMLMAVGMNKLRVFLMIMYETVFLTMVGAPLGMFMGWVAIQYFGKKGIDLAAFSEGLSQYGFDTMIYTALTPEFYIQVAVMVVATALISAIFPAWRALRLKPVEAIHSL